MYNIEIHELAQSLLKFHPLPTPHLKQGETVGYIANAKPIKAISPAGLPRLSTEVGAVIAKADDVRGGTITASFSQKVPLGYLCLLCITGQRLLFLTIDPARKNAELLWGLPGSGVTGIEKNPTVSTFKSIIKALGVSSSEILDN